MDTHRANGTEDFKQQLETRGPSTKGFQPQLTDLKMKNPKTWELLPAWGGKSGTVGRWRWIRSVLEVGGDRPWREWGTPL